MIRLSLPGAALWLGMTAMLGASLIMVTARAGFAQQGPIRLFPHPDATRSAPAPAATPDRDRATPGSEPAARAAAPLRSAPLSEPGRGLVVEGLAAPELDAIGLTGASAGGFDRTLWQGSDPEVTLELLADLPVASRVPALRRLTRKLLASGSAVGDSRGGGRLLAARVERLIAMGDLETAKMLVDQLPAIATDSQLARLAAEVALLTGDEETACRLANAIGATSGAEFWAKVTIYCRLAANDPGGAQLGLDLLREARQTADSTFFALATAIVEQAAAPLLQGLARPSPIHVALLALAGWPLPPEALAEASPPVLAAAARAPALAGSEELAITEQAFLVGAASADRVAAAYAEHAGAVGADVIREIHDSWDAGTRATAFAAVRNQGDQLARAELLDATWRAAGGAERFLIAEVFAAPFGELPVEEPFVGVAPSVARALLATDRLVPAGRWLSLLDAGARQDPRLEREATGLAPLFALAGIGGSAAVPRLDAAAVEGWMPGATADGVAVERLLALLESVGAPIETAVWGGLLPAHAGREEGAPASVLWRGLERAAAEGRVGDTVLFALQMLDGRPQAVHPEVLVACLRALRRVGLDQDARALAVATALIDGF